VTKYNFVIGPVDTDSISFCKQSMRPFTDDQIKHLLAELNEISPDMMIWEDDGLYDACIVFKAKNYVLKRGNKITIRGSGLKDAKKEPALKEMSRQFLDAILEDRIPDIPDIYKSYILEVRDGVKDIKRWASKKTLTDKIWSSPRENEAKVLRAIAGTEYKEADKVYTFFLPSGELCLVEKYAGEYDKDKMYEKIYKTAQFFTAVLSDDIFVNYKLKKNAPLLSGLQRESK
jgi:DNA polymerase elongation subunit (family B)